MTRSALTLLLLTGLSTAAPKPKGPGDVTDDFQCFRQMCVVGGDERLYALRGQKCFLKKSVVIRCDVDFATQLDQQAMTRSRLLIDTKHFPEPLLQTFIANYLPGEFGQGERVVLDVLIFDQRAIKVKIVDEKYRP